MTRKGEGNSTIRKETEKLGILEEENESANVCSSANN